MTTIKRNSKIKVLFVIPSLVGYGAEVSLIRLLSWLDRDTFAPSVAVFRSEGQHLEALSRDMDVHHLNARNPFQLLRAVYSLAFDIYPRVRPDLVVGWLGSANLVAILSKMIARRSPKVMISEHNTQSINLRHKRLGRIWKALMRLLYPKADGIICISNGVVDDLAEHFGVPRDRMTMIYNGFDLAQIQKLSRADVPERFGIGKRPTIVACGRLTRQKNYPLLLNAFARLRNTTDARLIILGDGEEEENLKRLAQSLDISDDTCFLGYDENPFKYIARCTVFAHSADWEGICNAIIETVICGVPVVATDCKSGPNEIIKDGVHGFLVPTGDADVLSNALLRIIEDDKLRNEMADAAKTRSLDFEMQKYVEQYDNLFRSVARDKQE